MPSSTPHDPLSSVPAPLPERARCAHCGDIIGIYEPLVVGEGIDSYETSLFADPHLEGSEVCLFHLACRTGSGALR